MLPVLVLTAVRSGEARGATWDEIDLQGQVWRIPSERMKAGVEHRVPLSVQALDLLGEASALRDETELVFPSPRKPGSPMSDMTLTKILRSTGLAERATVHGFRSSFKNWILEQMDTPWAVSESALAHILGNSTEQAYATSDLFERRRALMRATVHGFRSSFKNWILEQMDTPWAVSESALAHILGNSTEQAYATSDLFERRRALMQLWADYLTG